MPREIKDLTSEGLPSKMYFLLYPEPNSIYAISKEIYEYPQPQKLYSWRDKLKEKEYIKEIRGKWISTPNPVLEKIKKILDERNIQLNDSETRKLWEKLDSDGFRDIVEKTKKLVDISGDFDGARIIITAFDSIITPGCLIKKTYPEIFPPDDKLDELYDENSKVVLDIVKNIFKSTGINKDFIPDTEEDMMKLTFWMNIKLSLLEKIKGLTLFGQAFVSTWEFNQKLQKGIKGVNKLKPEG